VVVEEDEFRLLVLLERPDRPAEAGCDLEEVLVLLPLAADTAAATAVSSASVGPAAVNRGLQLLLLPLLSLVAWLVGCVSRLVVRACGGSSHCAPRPGVKMFS